MGILSARMSRTESLWYGLSLPLLAARLLLRRPTLLARALVPVILALALYFWIIRSGLRGVQGVILEAFRTMGWNPEALWAWAILLASKLTLFLVAALTFSFATTLIAAPFNDWLAEASERFATPPLAASPAPGLSARMRLATLDLAKSVFATVATIAAVFLSWVPVLNALAFALAMLLIAFQYLSYPQTRRGIGLLRGLLFLARHPYSCVGFGFSISLLFALPGVQTLALPLAVVGGTLLFARAQSPLAPR